MAGHQKYTSEFRESAVKLVIGEGRRPWLDGTSLPCR